MTECKICSVRGKRHFAYCPFSNVMQRRSIPMWSLLPKTLDYLLCSKDLNKKIKSDFDKDKLKYMGDGIFKEV